jgi:hypothetical protein
MSAFVVVLLAALWVAILVPGALRGRHHSPATSVDSFERSMRILATDLRNRLPGDRPIGGGGALVTDLRTARPARPPTAAGTARERTLERRRVVLRSLGTATGAAAVLAVAFAGAFVVVFGALAVALSAYVALLVHLRSTKERVRRTVRRLPVRAEGQPDDLPLADGEHP